MSYLLLHSAAFVRAAKRLVKRNSSAAMDIEATLSRLSEDPFDATLKSHRLKGSLKGSWACSAGYDLRIIFSFVEYEEKPALLLLTIGTHDEVY